MGVPTRSVAPAPPSPPNPSSRDPPRATQLLSGALPDYFKLTIVVTVEPQAGGPASSSSAPSSASAAPPPSSQFSFKCSDGAVAPLGPGASFPDTVAAKARALSLTVGGTNLIFSFYPDSAYFDSYFSLYSAYQIIGACIALVVITGARSALDPDRAPASGLSRPRAQE